MAKREQRFLCPYPDNKSGWTFVRRAVSTCLKNDLQRVHKWTASEQAEVQQQHSTPSLKHALAQLIYERWQAMQVCTDDAGGNVPGGRLLLRPYALFQLSLDRIDNQRPHFIHNGLSNVNFVPLGMNTAYGVVGLWGKHACWQLRARVQRHASLDRAFIVMRHCSGSKTKGNKCYQNLKRIFLRDSATRVSFASLAQFYEYAMFLLRQQEGRCAVSSLFMEHEDLGMPSVCGAFQPSLDAVQPNLHHTRGNLRWVCRFLNSINMDKRKLKHACVVEEAPTAWTAELFQHYIGHAPANRQRETRIF